MSLTGRSDGDYRSPKREVGAVRPQSAPELPAGIPGRLEASQRRRAAAVALTSRRPPRPGEFLDTRYLRPLGINQTELAQALGISRRRVNELVNGRRAITPDTAVRLALYFGNEAAFWMHLQVAWDMHLAVREMRAARRK